MTLNSPLVDSQGFPLNTIDIVSRYAGIKRGAECSRSRHLLQPSVREARSRIIALQNDRKDIDGQLKDLLEVALARDA